LGDYNEYSFEVVVITFIFLHKNFFNPLNLLLKGANKVKSGQKIEVLDIVEKNEMGNLLSTFYIMSEKVYEREKSLSYQTKHDDLTGLKNRKTVLQEIEESILESQKTCNKTAILFIDLNLFKQINDTLGHDVGDLILKETANRLTASVRATDTIFRMGGDEFLVILKNAKDIENVRRIIEKILNKFRTPVNVKGETIDISLSIGASLSPDDTTNYSELMEFSDIAMYTSKKDKNSAYKIFERDMLKRAGGYKSANQRIRIGPPSESRITERIHESESAESGSDHREHPVIVEKVQKNRPFLA